MDQPGKVANRTRGQLLSWSAEQGEIIFPCPRSRLRIWTRETGSAVPSCVSLVILHTRAESGSYSRNSSRFPRRASICLLNRHRPTGQSRVYRVTQLRADGVHCRESAGTEPVVVEVDPVTGWCLCRSSWANPFVCACVCVFYHIHHWYKVGMLKVLKAVQCILLIIREG